VADAAKRPVATLSGESEEKEIKCTSKRQE